MLERYKIPPLTYSRLRYMAEILPIRHKTLFNQSINRSFPVKVENVGVCLQ